MSRAFGGYQCLQALLLASTAIVSLPLMQSAWAQQPAATQGNTVNFNIPAQPLTSALTAFARQSGVQLAYPASLTAGKSAPALQGTLARDAALSRLLSGSGLTYSFTGSNTATISSPNAGGAATVDGAIALDTIDVSGGGAGAAAADLPFQTPGSTAFVSAEQISRVPPTSVADIFKGVPGVLSAQSRNSAALDVNIRGMQGMNRVKTTVDDADQMTSTWRGYAGVDNRTFVDPDFIGGIGIDKGPNGLGSGAGAIGGVVAITTLTANDILLPGQTYGIRLKGEKASNMIDREAGNTTARTDSTNLFDSDAGSGSFVGAYKNENVDFVAAVSRRKSGNYFAGEHGPTSYQYLNTITNTYLERSLSPIGRGNEVFNTSQDMLSGLIKGTVTWGDGHSFRLGYIYYDNNYGEVTPSLIGQVGTYRDIPLTETTVHNLSSQYRYNPSGNDLVDLRFKLWGTHTEETTQNTVYFNTYPIFTKTAMVGGELSNRSRIETTFGELASIYGASFSIERAQPNGPMSYADAIPVNGERQIGSLFIRNEWSPYQWLMLNAGLRYDTYRVEDKWDSNPFPSGVTPPPDYPTHSGGDLNPSAGLTITPWEGIQLFGQYAQGTRPVSLREGTLSVSRLMPNPDLEPETSRNWELGINVKRDGVFRNDDRFRAKIAYFNNTVDNYIFREYNDPYLTNPPATRPFSEFIIDNLRKAKFSGVEVQVSYDARTFFTEIGATYYDNIEYCKVGEACKARAPSADWPPIPGYPPPYDQGVPYSADYSTNHIPPEFMITGTFGLRFFEEALTLGTRVTYANRPKVPSVTGMAGDMRAHWEPFTTIDLFGIYKFNENMTWNVSAENVTNRYYIDPIGGVGLPAPGRTIRTGLTMKF